jgi:hypothetical protein
MNGHTELHGDTSETTALLNERQYRHPIRVIIYSPLDSFPAFQRLLSENGEQNDGIQGTRWKYYCMIVLGCLAMLFLLKAYLRSTVHI